MDYQKPGIYPGNNNTEYLQAYQQQQQQQQQAQQQQRSIPNMPQNNASNFIQPGYGSMAQQQYQYGSNTNLANNNGNNYSYPQIQTRANNNVIPPSYLATNLGLNPQDYNNNMTSNILSDEHNRSGISPGSSTNSPHGNNELLDPISNVFMPINDSAKMSISGSNNDLYRGQKKSISNNSSNGTYENNSMSNSSSNNINVNSTPNNNNLNNINNNTSGPQLSEAEIKARKKAQNRAAQKAFRERKENKMKELEEKLIASERNRQELLREIDELKKLNMEINTENKILLQKSNNAANSNANNYGSNSPNDEMMDTDNNNGNSNFSFPTEDEFYETMVIDSIRNDKNNKIFRHEDGTINQQSFIRENMQFTDESGKQFLTVPATWDYLSELQESKDFDVYFVMQSLKGKEICDEHGPSYPRGLIDRLVQRASNQ